jgi:hypothetical protein
MTRTSISLDQKDLKKQRSMSLPSRQTPIIGSIQRTLYPDQLQPDNLLALQRTVGNRAVQI